MSWYISSFAFLCFVLNFYSLIVPVFPKYCFFSSHFLFSFSFLFSLIFICRLFQFFSHSMLLLVFLSCLFRFSVLSFSLIFMSSIVPVFPKYHSFFCHVLLSFPLSFSLILMLSIVPFCPYSITRFCCHIFLLFLFLIGLPSVLVPVSRNFF